MKKNEDDNFYPCEEITFNGKKVQVVYVKMQNQVAQFIYECPKTGERMKVRGLFDKEDEEKKDPLP